MRCTPTELDIQTVFVDSMYRAGETVHLRLDKERSTNGEFDGFGVTPISVQIEEVDNEGALLRWQSGVTEIAGISAGELEAIGLSLDDAPKQNILYRLSLEGVFIGVENVDEVRRAAIATVDFMAEGLGEDRNTQQVRLLLAQLGDEELASLFAEEPILFHLLDGVELGVDEKIEYSDLLTNALGGEPFPATSTVEMTALRDSDGCVEITLKTTPNPGELQRILFDSVANAFDVPLDEADRDEFVESFSVENSVVVSIDHTTGVVQEVVATQEIAADGQTRLDTTTITRLTEVPPPVDRTQGPAPTATLSECDSDGFRTVTLQLEGEAETIQWYIDGKPASQPTSRVPAHTKKIRGDGKDHVIQYTVVEPNTISGNSGEFFSAACP